LLSLDHLAVFGYFGAFDNIVVDMHVHTQLCKDELLLC